MSPEERDPALLWDMLHAAEAVRSFVVGKTFEDYTRDLMLKSAVERQVEIIGEAARKVSTSLRAQHPEIAWELIAKQRHVLAHDYDRIRDDLLWRVATLHLPDLIAKLTPLLPPLDDRQPD